ncbi:hypothetical protein C8R44DRAFT_742504 [Mycena epipterygia]|nr:hypothetical protein C8R44DRAFT_742504 [Mycena epipterygia]
MPVETRGDKRRGKRQRRKAREAAGLAASGSGDASGATTGEIPSVAPIVESIELRSEVDRRPVTSDSARNPPSSANLPNLTFGSSIGSLTPSLTPSVAELAFHRALINRQSNNKSGESDVSQRAPNITFAATSTRIGVAKDAADLPQGPDPRRKGRNSTIEEIVDGDDRRHPQETGSPLHSILNRQVAPTAPPTRLHERQGGVASAMSPNVPMQNDERPVNVPLPPSSATTSTRSAERVNSPDPMSSILNGYVAEDAPTSERNKRKNEKQRDEGPMESGGESESSASSDASNDDDPVRPNQWDEANRRTAAAAMARERDMFANPALYQQRRAIFLENEARMRELRVEDDRAFAEQILAQDSAEVDDHAFAQRIAREEEDLRILSQEIMATTLEVEQQEARMRALTEAARLQHEASERSKRELADKQAREKLATAAMAQLHKHAGSRTSSVRDALGSKPGSERVHTLEESSPEVVPERITHTFRDRVILQRMRLQDLMKTGRSSTADQGISWDEDGKPYEVGPAPSRGSSVGTKGGRVKRSPGAGDVKDARQLRSTLNPDKGPAVSHPGDLTGKGFQGAAAESSRREGEPSGPGKRPDARVDPPQQGGKSGYYNNSGTAPVAAPVGNPDDDPSSSGEDSSSESDEGTDRRYREEIKKSSTSESDSAFGDLHRSNSKSKRSWKKSKKRGVRRKTATGTTPGGPGPDPSDSDSESSREGSDSSKGPSHPTRRYADETESSYQRRRKRNSRRKHHKRGHRLESIEPDAGASSKASKRNINKWKESLHHHYEKYLHETLGEELPASGMVTREPRDRDTPRDNPRMAAARPENGGRATHWVRKEPIENEPRKRDFRPDTARIIPKNTSRPQGRDGGGYRGSKPVKPGITCYNCGGAHYKNECPFPDKTPEAMRAAREETRQATEPPPEAPSEHLRRAQEETHPPEEEPLEGDQYDSDFTEEEVGTEYSYGDNGERCAHLMEEDIPPLQEVSDSDEDSECGSDYADEFGSEYSYSSYESFVTADSEAESFVTANEEPEPPVKRTIWDLPAQDRGMFELVDDLPDEEFVGPKDIDKLAREIAAYMLYTGASAEDTFELFTAGREIDPTVKAVELRRVPKRAVYLKRSKVVRPRPPRTAAGQISPAPPPKPPPPEPGPSAKAEPARSRRIATRNGHVTGEEIPDEESIADLIRVTLPLEVEDLFIPEAEITDQNGNDGMQILRTGSVWEQNEIIAPGKTSHN